MEENKQEDLVNNNTLNNNQNTITGNETITQNTVQNTVVQPVEPSVTPVMNTVSVTPVEPAVTPLMNTTPVEPSVTPVMNTVPVTPVEPSVTPVMNTNTNNVPFQTVNLTPSVTNTQSIEPETSIGVTTRQNVENEPKKKNNKIIIIILAILLLVGAGIFLYFNMQSNKAKFLKALTNEYKQLVNTNAANESIYEEVKDSSVVYKGNFNLDIIPNEQALSAENANIVNTLKNINKLDFNYEAGIDYKNKKSYASFNTNYDTSLLVNLNVYNKENKTYVFLKDLYSKYIEINDVDATSLYNNEIVSSNDISYIANTVYGYILESLEEDDFVKDGNKITYTINNETIEKTGNKTIEKLMNDKEFLKKTSEIYGQKEEDLLKALEEFDFKSEEEIKIEVSLYLDKKNLEKMVILTSSYDVKEEIIYEVKEKRTLTYKREKDTVLTITFDKKENGSELKLNVPSNNLELTVNTTNNKNTTTSDILMNLKDSGTSLNSKMTFKNDKLEKDFNLELNLLQDQTNVFTVKMNNKTNILLHEKVTIPEITNIINEDDITEADEQEISNNISNNQTIMKFIQDFTQNMQ